MTDHIADSIHDTPPAPTEPPPPTAPPRQPVTVAVMGLFIIAVLYTVYFARDVLLPICLALILSFLLRPLVRGLYRLGIPESIGAAITVVSLCGLLGLGIYTLTVPATQWVDRVPRVVHDLEFKLGDLRAGLERARKASQQIEQIAGSQAGDESSPSREVVLRGPSLAEQFLRQSEAVIANVVILQVLLYFFLARGRQSLETLIGTMTSIDDRVHYATVAGTVQQNIATYLVTITIINIMLGIAAGGILWLEGVPNPALWGTLATVLNYIPFIGPAVVTAVLLPVSVLTFDRLSDTLLPPLSFVALVTLEGNFLTPLIVGRRLSLNPIAVFISILFWGWMWGIPGALLAVPILAIVKILCDAHEPLKTLGVLLGHGE